MTRKTIAALPALCLALIFMAVDPSMAGMADRIKKFMEVKQAGSGFKNNHLATAYNTGSDGNNQYSILTGISFDTTPSGLDDDDTIDSDDIVNPPHWVTGDWGSCSAMCAGGTMSRTVACVDGDGNAADETLCQASSKPAASQVCNDRACGYAWHVFGPPNENVVEWIRVPWGTARTRCYRGATSPVYCGGGTAMLDIYCMREDRWNLATGRVDDSYCAPTPKPANTTSCSMEPCVYEWKLGEWGACQSLAGVCLSGQCYKKRSVGCYVAGTDRPAPEARCGTKPSDAGYQPAPEVSCDLNLVTTKDLGMTIGTESNAKYNEGHAYNQCGGRSGSNIRFTQGGSKDTVFTFRVVEEPGYALPRSSFTFEVKCDGNGQYADDYIVVNGTSRRNVSMTINAFQKSNCSQYVIIPTYGCRADTIGTVTKARVLLDVKEYTATVN